MTLKVLIIFNDIYSLYNYMLSNSGCCVFLVVVVFIKNQEYIVYQTVLKEKNQCDNIAKTADVHFYAPNAKVATNIP